MRKQHGGELTRIGPLEGTIALDGERAWRRQRVKLRPLGTIVGHSQVRRRPMRRAQLHRVGRARPRAHTLSDRLEAGAEDGEVLVRQLEGDAGVTRIEARRGLPDVGEMSRRARRGAGRFPEEHEARGVGRPVFDGDVERVEGHGAKCGSLMLNSVRSRLEGCC